MLRRIRSSYVTLLVLLIALIYVWSSKWFLTTDGPSHAYNAYLLSELLTGDDFFSQFLHISFNLFPNWTGHLLLMGIQQVFDLHIAEKILFSTYVFVYVVGYHKLGLRWKVDPRLLVAMTALFLFPKTFVTGFFNNQFGFALLPWALIALESVWEKADRGAVVRLMLVALLMYITHPLALVVFYGILGLRLFVSIISKGEDGMVRLRSIVVALLPSMALFVYYIATSGTSDAEPVVRNHKALLFGFLELDSLTNYYRGREWPVNRGAVVTVLVLFIASLVRLRGARITALQWSLIICAVVWTGLYFFHPPELAGGGVLGFRIQFVPYVLLVLFAQTVDLNVRFSSVLSWVSFLLFALMLNIRHPHKQIASDAVEEMMSVAHHLSPKQVTVGLSCWHSGWYENKPISKAGWIFIHAADYLHAKQEQLGLINYEAALAHFPIKWNDSFYPYEDLACRDGLEHLPPCMELKQSEQQLGVKVDHVVLLFPEHPLVGQHPNYLRTIQGLKEHGFELRQESPNGVVHLYSRTSSTTL